MNQKMNKYSRMSRIPSPLTAESSSNGQNGRPAIIARPSIISLSRALLTGVAFAGALFSGNVAKATDYTWSGPSPATTVAPADGVWNTTLSNWNGPTYTPWINGTGNNAIFGGAGTGSVAVTVGSAITGNSIQFTSATEAYTLSADSPQTITLNSVANGNTNGAMQVGSGVTATIGSGITVGGAAGSTYINGGGTLNLASGSAIVKSGQNNNLVVTNATLNNAGSISVYSFQTGTAGVGAVNSNVNITGALTAANTIFVAFGGANATSDFIIGSGASVSTATRFQLSSGLVGQTARVFLNGGTLATPAVNNNNNGASSASTNFFFNSGTLQAGASTALFMQGLTNAYVGGTSSTADSGAVIDTNSFNITIGQSLQTGAGVAGSSTPTATVDGGLTKNGAGTLTLTAANSYTGKTTINAGTLVLSNNSAAGTGSVVVNGGILSVASGVNPTNAVTLAGGSYNKSYASGAAYNTYRATSSFAGGAQDTTASFRAGTTDAAQTVSTTFMSQPTFAATNDGSRISDVFSLSGTATNVFTLQLQVLSLPTESLLAWNDGDAWVNAVFSNVGAGTLAGAYSVSWDTFLANNGGVFNGATMLGAYGYDTTSNTAWAVLNQSGGDFSVIAAVPEPSTIILAVLGLSMVLFRLRKKAVRL